MIRLDDSVVSTGKQLLIVRDYGIMGIVMRHLRKGAVLGNDGGTGQRPTCNY